MKGAHTTEGNVLHGGVEDGGASLEVLVGSRQGCDAAMSTKSGFAESCALGTEIVDGTSLTASRKTRCTRVSAQRADKREAAGKSFNDEAGLREADTMKVLIDECKVYTRRGGSSENRANMRRSTSQGVNCSRSKCSSTGAKVNQSSAANVMQVCGGKSSHGMVGDAQRADQGLSVEAVQQLESKTRVVSGKAAESR